MSRQLAEQGEACLVRRLPRPRARWLAGQGENFTTPSVYSSSLLRTLVSTPSIYLYKATMENILCIYTRPPTIIETKVNAIFLNQ